MMDHADPRRILLAVTGLTPQVVTETLYALACRTEDPWIPHEVHLITTSTGASNAQLNLLNPDGWFHRLCADYHLPAIAFPEANIHVLCDDQGQPLEDIRTQAHNTLAADFITEVVRQLTADPQSELHVSIAGGRKTMGYYLGYALSLYGRPQDRLSHVLVSDPYETNREFYYPTPYLHRIHSKRGDKEVTLDARHAVVDLAAIPFVQLRQGLPDNLRHGQTTFTRAVATANRGMEPPRLEIDISQYQVRADDQVVKLSETECLVLLWLAQRAARGEAATDWSARDMAEEFLGLVAQVTNPMSGHYDRIARTFEESHFVAVRIGKYFEPHKSRINKVFEQTLGTLPAARYQIDRVRHAERTYFCLPLEPDQISIQSH